MNLKGEVHVGFVKGLENGAEAFSEVGEAGIPVGLGSWWEGVYRMPDGGAGEPIYDGGEVVVFAVSGFDIEKGTGSASRSDHVPCGAFADTLGITIAPDGGRKDGLVALVDEIADGLADKVVGDGVAGESVVLEKRPFIVDVFFGRGGDLDVEMVTPAGEFDAIIAHLFGERGEFFEREVGPLAGEEGYGT